MFAIARSCCALLLLAVAVQAQARLDLNNPDQALKAQQKIQCSLTDGKPALFWWKGKVFSRVPGERDRHLFNVDGMNIRACKSFNDPQKGYGYRMVSRELLLYLDPETNQILRTWKNPFTGKDVEVIHVANDPVNQGPSFAQGRFKFNATFKNGRFFQGIEVPLFYKNPLAGDFQDNIGGTYHAMEALTAAAPMDDVTDPNAKEVKDRVLSWVRISKWLPWMKMGDRAGVVIFHTAGMRLNSWDEMPEEVKAEVKQNWPMFQTAPPPDDARPSMTSWDQFKRWADEKKKK